MTHPCTARFSATFRVVVASFASCCVAVHNGDNEVPLEVLRDHEYVLATIAYVAQHSHRIASNASLRYMSSR